MLPFLINHMSEARIEAARLTLVDDVSGLAIASQFGWSSRQTVSDAVNAVFAGWARYEASVKNSEVASDTALIPLGWELVTIHAPPALATKFRKLVANELGKVMAVVHNTQVHATKGPPRTRKSQEVVAAEPATKKRRRKRPLQAPTHQARD